MRTAALAVLTLSLAAACGPEPLGPREASSSGQERGPATAAVAPAPDMPVEPDAPEPDAGAPDGG